MHAQLVEVNDDCSFQAARAYKLTEPVNESGEPVLNPVMKVMCTTSQTNHPEVGQRASPHAR